MPTEELFGAYHFLLEADATSKLKSAGVNLSRRGLEQAARRQAITNPKDRAEIAKLLAKTAENPVKFSQRAG